MSVPTHAALLLAAGGSRRLGQPKALLQRDGEPLVRRIARLLLDTRPVGLLVVLGADHAAIGAALHGLALRTLHNADWQDGMSTSLRAGAAALAQHAGPTLIATVDQYRLDASHLAALLAPPHDDHDITSAYANTVGVPARVTAATLRRAHELGGDRGFGAFWRSTPGQLRRIDAPALADDLDTPDALARAIAHGWIDAG